MEDQLRKHVRGHAGLQLSAGVSTLAARIAASWAGRETGAGVGLVYFKINSRFGAQVNLENLLDADYHLFANGNNNITPGSPRSVRFGLTKRF